MVGFVGAVDDVAHDQEEDRTLGGVLDVDLLCHCFRHVFLHFTCDAGVAGGVEFDLSAVPDGGDLGGTDDVFEFDDRVALGRLHRPCLAVVGGCGCCARGGRAVV